MRQDHPAAAAETLDLREWLASPHVVVSGRGDPRGSVDAALERVGRNRRVAVVAPTFLYALELLNGSDLFGTFPSGVTASLAAAHLVSRTPPIELEPVSLRLVRHRRTDGDPAVKLIARLVRGIVRELTKS